MRFNENPTSESLFDAVKYLKLFCNTFNKTKSAMLQIAPCSDHLNWKTTFNMFRNVFNDIGTDITISIFTAVKHEISLVELFNKNFYR